MVEDVVRFYEVNVLDEGVVEVVCFFNCMYCVFFFL